MRTRWFTLAVTALVFGAIGGMLFAPQPAGAVNRDMVELQQTVSQILQGQQDLRSAVDSNNATLRTLIQQSLDSVNQMNGKMADLQKTVQEVQANTGSRIDTIGQQTQGVSDNLQDMQTRFGKLSQQLTDIQNLLQGIDAKVSGGGSSAPPNGQPASGGPSSSPAGSPSGGGYGSPSGGSSGPGAYSSPSGPPPGPAAAPAYSSPSAGNAGGNMTPASLPPVSADTLYQNALRDFTSGHYDLSRQEFSDYIHNFPSNDLASNSQFYLGEIFYAQGDYKNAITAYDMVLSKYPQSFKLAASLLKKAQAELALSMKTSGVRDLREVVRRFPGSDESRRATTRLHEMGLAATAPRTTH